MRLLVLDDEGPLASFLVAVAHGLGWTTRITMDVASFQEAVRRAPPDLVMLDLRLGASDGIEQLRFLGCARYRGQVVVMSGLDPRVLESAKQVGASLGLSIFATMQKPLRAIEVRHVLTAAWQRTTAPLHPDALVEADALAEADAIAPPAPASLEQLTTGDVARALDRGGLRLVLQPIVAAATGKIVKFEALLRWPHPELGGIEPERFVSLAEQDGDLIDRLTLWVVRAAIDHYRHLAKGYAAVPIAINVSGANLRRLDFPDLMAGIAAEGGVAPSVLTLEVTEGVAMDDAGATADILTRLRVKGFGLAMDDFGTGYSSLRALREMPFSELKIDKSFILDLGTSRDSLVIVKSVIGLANNLGLATVAEGVETAAAARLLDELGISSIQGFHIARPMPLPRALDWVKDWNKSTHVRPLAPPSAGVLREIELAAQLGPEA